ncbi:MAG TPA: hypothetical protein DFR83_13990, partial [Deltaproteobacteria bacterium]|nr:hypothetical protein [Deltaproteobacteria bacterium]
MKCSPDILRTGTPRPSRHNGAPFTRQTFLGVGLALGVLGCKQDMPLPYVGPCADYPNGVYDFGQIGIGTCLSGSTEVKFTDDEDGNPVLVVTNANTYQNFTGGSLVTVPWNQIDLNTPRNRVSDIGAAAVDLPDFAGGLAITGDLAMVTVRLSEGARIRQHWDDVWLVDLSDPYNPVLSERGTDSTATIQVQSDPNDVEIDPISGYAFVSNRTTHSISVLDTDQDEVALIRPWPEAVLSSARWFDTDGSGSRGALDELEILDPSFIVDDNWSMDWIAGTWRVWVEAEGGVRRYNNYGGEEWRTSDVGIEMEFNEILGPDGRVTDPTFTALGNMYYASDDTIRTARSLGDTAGLWQYSPIVTLGPRDGFWDDFRVGGPGALLEDAGLNMFYDGLGSDLTSVSAIGYAWSPDGLAFERDDDPVLEASEDWESGGLFDPAPILDPETGQLTVYYSAFDGAQWRIGRATTWDRFNWNKELEPIFEVDGVDVAAPDISPSVGQWRMTYARRVDGAPWELWEAESPDGRLWNEIGPIAVLDDSVA